MLTSASDLVALMETIYKVSDHPKLSKSDKKDILEEMRRELPAQQLCRFSINTLNIVTKTLDEAINATTAAKSESSTSDRAKVSSESPKAELLRGAGQNAGRKSVKRKVG